MDYQTITLYFSVNSKLINMSHSIGAIKFNNGEIRYYEYNGTSDTVLSCHYPSQEEVLEHCRNQPHNHCTCGCEEEVSIYSSYGGGFYFKGKACKKCCSVHPDEYHFETIEPQGTDDWAKELFLVLI